MQSSPQGVAFIAAHEGFVSKAYRCPAGVITIGCGFTMRSTVFAAWWRAKYGRDLRMGDVIGKTDALALLSRLIDEEYGAPVNAKVKPRQQHHYDGASSVSFNCGPRALAWKWAVALAQGKVAEAARLLRGTATTANGKQLPGLVRRRAEEAVLIERGDYGSAALPPSVPPPSVSASPLDVQWYQARLNTLGYTCPTNGVADSRTIAAVKAFQRDKDLVADGIVGPATRATLIRALDARATTQATGGAAAGTGTAAGGVETVTTVDPATADIALTALMWGAGAAIVVLLALLIWRNRGRFTGQRVPT